MARWWEDVIHADGTLGRLRRSEVIGTVAEFPTRRLAMQALSQRLGTINTGKARPQSVRTFGSFVKDDWTPVVLPTLKYATQKHYRYMLDVHLIPSFGQRQLRELTREELQSFLSRKLKGGLSWETVHHFKCGLSKILGAAEEWGYIAENAAQKTKLPRRQHGTERTVLTPVQVRNLVTALNHPARSVTLLLVLTGLRVGELLALRWGSIDLNARMLRVCETVYDGHFDQPKTKRSARTIPIGTETAEIFTAIRPSVVDARALVFATREGLPLERWNLLRKHLKPAARKLGLPGVTWHLLRHSHATMLDSVGTPIGTMQSLLGHSTPDITREIYLHAIPEEQRRAVESVERLLFGPIWTQVQPPAQPASARLN
ncbi:MAG TPA: tyrosine-type recombinase/integrase [Candidatus Sulfotelmatobacter sp.]|nr:tyrosine-type recombinase/integrase [Candidatus Sulfotelmatobacter sp.]